MLAGSLEHLMLEAFFSIRTLLQPDWERGDANSRYHPIVLRRKRQTIREKLRFAALQDALDEAAMSQS